MKTLRGLLFADPAIALATVFFGTISLIVSFLIRLAQYKSASLVHGLELYLR